MTQTSTLTPGQTYDVDALTLLGWTEGDGSGHEGYALADYFRAGRYLGPDAHGIEPLVIVSEPEYTHVVVERGNGLPTIGDRVLIEDAHGWHRVERIVAMSPIATGDPMRGVGHAIYVALDGDDTYADMTEAEQDAAYADLPHASAIDE